MKLTLGIVAALGLASLANAQTGQSVITIQAGDLGCSTRVGAGLFAVQGWTFGASNAPTGPASAGRVQLTALTITKEFDECSAAIFAAVATGRRLKSVLLVQSDASGKQRLLTVQLGDVLVSNYQLGGTPAAPEPAESISLSFAQITITNPKNSSHAGWDLKVNSAI